MKLKIIIIVCGIILGLISMETFLYFYYGFPKNKILKEISNNTYEAEFDVYRNRFVKKINPETNEIGYVSRQKINRNSFSVIKSSNTKRIFILGESIAELFGMSWENLESQFKNQLPQYDFEVINCGRAGFESCRIFLIFKEIINYDPDLIILMMGNNINIPPPKKKFNKVTLFLYEHLWSYYLLNNIYSKKNNNQKHEPVINKMLLYEKNLDKILQICEKLKIPILLFTTPSNFKDFIEEEIPLNNKDFFLAKLKLENNEIIQAKNILLKLRNNTDNSQVINFYLGKCYEYLKQHEVAKNFITNHFSIKKVQYFIIQHSIQK